MEKLVVYEDLIFERLVSGNMIDGKICTSSISIILLFRFTWEAEGAYTDPTADLANRDELVDWIGKFLAQSPGARFTLEGKIDTHHNHVRFFWRLHFADGSQAPGMDYGEISAGGKLKRIVGFF